MCWLINVFSRLSNFILTIVCQQIHKNGPSIKTKSRRSVDGGKMTSGVAIGEEAIAERPKDKEDGERVGRGDTKCICYCFWVHVF